MVHYLPERVCKIPWCWRESAHPADTQSPHQFCSHHWMLATERSRSRFVTTARRRRAIDAMWAHQKTYDDIVKRGRFLKLCHVTLFAKEREDAAADALQLDMVKADRDLDN